MYAEEDRAYVNKMKQWEKFEAEVMKDVPGWKVDCFLSSLIHLVLGFGLLGVFVEGQG